MHLGVEVFGRGIDIEGRVFETGVGERGNGVERSVGVHAEIWARILEGCVEAKWLSKAVVLMRMLEGKHLKRARIASAGDHESTLLNTVQMSYCQKEVVRSAWGGDQY